MHVLVVGGGIIGLLTAMECAMAGHAVTLVDRDRLPSPRGASDDQHRILRTYHPGDPETARASGAAHLRWLDLQDRLGADLYRCNGALTVLADSPRVDPLRADPLRADPAVAVDVAADAVSSDAGGGRLEVLSGAELAARYPQLRLGESALAVLEHDAGVLLADRVLRACLAWLAGRPDVVLRSGCGVDRIEPEPVRARLDDGSWIHADAVVVAAGAWSAGLAPAEPAPGLASAEPAPGIAVQRQSLLYCRVPVDRQAGWAELPAIPSFGVAAGAWLVPPVAGTLLKLSAASACRETDRPGRFRTPARQRAGLLEIFRPLIPGLTPAWVVGARDSCYASAADPPGLVAARWGDRAVGLLACGGVSFKLAPLIAGFLAALVIGDRPDHTGIAALDRLGAPEAGPASTTGGQPCGCSPSKLTRTPTTTAPATSSSSPSASMCSCSTESARPTSGTPNGCASSARRT